MFVKIVVFLGKVDNGRVIFKSIIELLKEIFLIKVCPYCGGTNLEYWDSRCKNLICQDCGKEVK